MHEKRSSPRYQVSIAGKLIAPDMSRFVDVEIKDLSEDGAFVAATSTIELPERVYLWEAVKGTLFECTVRWHKLGMFFGLRFTDSRGRERRRALIEAATAPPRAPLVFKAGARKTHRLGRRPPGIVLERSAG
jgi:hypothetical protein